MADNNTGVIVFGPAACGKTHNAEALRRHFGLRHIINEWDGQRPLRVQPGTLVLTRVDLSGGIGDDGWRVISFADAMREAGLPNNYRHGRSWLPSDWMDERPPQTGVTPEAFLRRNPDTGVLQLWRLDADEEDETSLDSYVRDLKDGDVVIFNWHEDRGHRLLTVDADSWSLNRPFGPDTNVFEEGSGQLELDGTIEAIVDALRDGSDPDDYPIVTGVAGWTWSSDIGFRVRAFESGAAHFEEISKEGEFQQRVAPWMQACFGPEISADRVERNDRFLEEALELVQACDGSRERAHALVDYVFDRPKGERWQEAGGVMVTLAALCLANGGLDMHQAGERELLRIWTKVEAIRAKQAAKPTGSALPQ